MSELREQMREVLTDLDRLFTAELGRFESLPPEAVDRGSLLRDGATDDEIVAAEQRLGIEFPPSYRAFLQVSNGAYFAGHGPSVVYADGRWVQLVPVSEIRPSTEATPITVKVWVDEMDEDLRDPLNATRVAPGHPAAITYWAPYRAGLVISTPEREHLALVPISDSEWQTWDVEHSEWQAHYSFLEYLAYLRGAAQRRAVAEHDLDEIADRAARGHVGLVEFLAEHHDPRAGEIARRLVTRRAEDFEHLPQLLGLLGEADSIPVLEELLSSGDVDRPDWAKRSTEEALARLRAAVG